MNYLKKQTMLYELILIFCLYIPFQLALNPAEGIDLASGRIIILFLFLLWLMQGLKNKKVIITPNLQTILIISFLALGAFSLIFSYNIEWSLRKLFFWLSIFPLYFIISGIKLSENKVKKIVRYLIWGAGISGAIAIFQFSLQFVFGIDKTFELWAVIITPFLGNSFAQAVLENPSWLASIGGYDFFRSTALFPDPHMLSFYLGITLPLSVGLYFTESGKRKTQLFLIGVIFLADWLTFSRGGYLGLLAGILFGLIFFWKKLEAGSKKALIAGTVLAVLIIATPNPISQRLISSFNLSEGSNQGRMETWKNSIDVIKNNPFLGVGLGNYALEIKPSADYREPIYSHSAYLDLAAETGILNSLIWMGILLAAVISFLKKADNASNLKSIYIGVAAGLIVFLIHSFFETALFSTRVLPLVIILIALSTYEKHS